MHRNRIPACLWSLLPVMWLFVACAAPADEQPDNLIPETRMATILTEIHLAESQVSRIGLGSLDSSNIVYKRLEGQIFRKFKVDTNAYNRSYVYYSSHPRQMETIYKQIVENLKKKSDVQQKQMHSKKPVKPLRS